MSGCDPLDGTTIERVIQTLSKGRNGQRDKALFILGLSTGLRISELLSLTVGDVMGTRAVLQSFYLKRRHTKGKTQGRKIEIPTEARKAIADHMQDMRRKGKGFKWQPLFMGQGRACAPLSRKQAWKMLHHAFILSGLRGQSGTHSMRKTFACRLYESQLQQQARGKTVDALRVVQHALGHRDIASTEKYLSSVVYDVRDDIEAFTSAMFRGE